MSTLQIEDFPEDLEVKLRVRAAHEGRSMGACAIGILERDLADVVDLIHQARDEREDKILGDLGEPD
jgi:plasmid stability protein